MPRSLEGGPTSVGTLSGVVALARLHLHVLARGADLEFAEAAVAVQVGRRIGERILRPHLLLDLLENILQRVLSVHPEQATAGFFGHLLQIAVADPEVT